ncbi:MAG: hypothetical protein JO306_02780 [Gemmatimonadetes bacterium]|nr:hypothetical protein [Gemmatimonadota bacterium]
MRIYEDRAAGEIVIESAAADVAGTSGHVQILPAEGTVPVGGWLHGYSVELVDAAGRPVPQQLLHHLIVLVPNRRGLFNASMLRLVAAGHETPVVKLPSVVGYRIHAGDRLVLAGMLHNESATAYRGVRVRVHMPLKREGGLIRPMSIFPFSMDVMPTGTQRAFDLPPGRSEKSWEGRPAVDGRIIGVGGHLHRYGVSLTLTDVTAGKVLWEGVPVRDSTGEIVSLPTHTFRLGLGVGIRADHVYRLTAVYDNPTRHTIVDGGMGAAGGAFVPSDQAAWPALDTSNPEYLLDERANSTDPAAHHHDMDGMPGMMMHHSATAPAGDAHPAPAPAAAPPTPGR